MGYDRLLERHIEEYQQYFNRVSMDLGPGREELPVPERLADWDKDVDPARFTLLFQYGRYLLISSSRPGTQPANLQGIWNQHLRAPWSSNYTVNINTEMNYWGAETVNLPEMHEPLFDLIRNLRISGGNTARIHYNAGGLYRIITVIYGAFPLPWETAARVRQCMLSGRFQPAG